MGKRHIQTRVPDELANNIDDYQENGDFMNQAEAIRSLLREGLDGKQDDNEEIEEAVQAAEQEAEEEVAHTTTGFLERIAQDIVFLPSVLFGLIGVLLPFPALYALEAGDTLLAGGILAVSFLLMIGATVVVVISALAQLALARPLRGLAGIGTEAEA